MKYLDQPRKMQFEIIKKTSFLALLPLIYFLLSGKIDIFLGLLFGLLISFLFLRLKLINIEHSLEMNEERAVKFIRTRYLIEYMVYFIVLIVAYKNPGLSFLAAAAGLFLIKITVMGWIIVELINEKFFYKL